MVLDECPLCRELLEQASAAILSHIRAVDRLDLALIRAEDDLLPALEVAVKEARLCRENAMGQYRHHQGMHRANQAGASA